MMILAARVTATQCSADPVQFGDQMPTTDGERRRDAWRAEAAKRA